MSKVRHKAILAVYLVLIHEGKVLLHLRKNSGYEDGKYSLVAGHVEANESLFQAMMRETKEEAGIEVFKEDLVLSSTLHRLAQDGERVDFFIRANRWKGKILNCEEHKCGDLSFFPLDKLPKNLIEYVRMGIFHSLANLSYFEMGWDQNRSQDPTKTG